jgi:prepilin-type N-terminal cleavage/methylation domain-containing protein
MVSSRRRAAFTLIELSIVLVIIGLIVGGILVGRDMIHNAEILSQISQLERIQAAVGAFRLKYNCLPGDCSYATTQLGFPRNPNENPEWGGDGTVHDGNGDDLIGEPNGYMFGGINTAAGIEWVLFWWHLQQANLLADGYNPLNTGGPGGTFGPMYYVPSKIRDNNIWAGYMPPTPIVNFYTTVGFGANALYLVGTSAKCAMYTCTSAFSEGITAAEGMAIDGKIDDGMPFTGTVRAIQGGGGFDNGIPLTDPAPDGCATAWSLTATYSNPTTNTNPRCDLAIKMTGG